ncbi:hypothetical protein DFH07DRAFT_868089 [Mycena maculata]|uniref:PARP catalytic domain-containing protein n=1 Tax=Mycena maculata TaxID=230809 RepID=A0AAD7NEU1_9AGAR|nr:hypothetical protein DFH07DRAFT_868089 [Mycena maculata]
MMFKLKRPSSWTKKKTTRLVVLDPQNPTFSQPTVEKHFQDAWKHPKKRKPKVHAIFEIILTEEMLVPYLRYRALVEISRVPRHANEQLLFHGTNRNCLLGDGKKRTRLCNTSRCLLCAVIRNSFDVAKCGKRHRFRRFGSGIYTTACSSKADDYYAGVRNSPFRAMLVNRVVVGNPLVRQHNAEDLTGLPNGYHSVVGVPGADLNYGETVVYSNDAIRPAYLIIYAADPPTEVHVDLRLMISALFKTPINSSLPATDSSLSATVKPVH